MKVLNFIIISVVIQFSIASVLILFGKGKISMMIEQALVQTVEF